MKYLNRRRKEKKQRKRKGGGERRRPGKEFIKKKLEIVERKDRRSKYKTLN